MLKQSYIPIAIISFVVLELIVGCKTEQLKRTEEPQIEVLESTQEGVQFRIQVPEFKMYSIETEVETFYRISPPNVKHHTLLGGPENVSYPEVPIYTTFVALPIEGEVEKIYIEPEGEPLTQQVKLYPVQPEQRNNTGKKDSVVFIYDRKKYTQKQTLVKDVVSFRPVQQVDANIYKLSINLVDYNPNTEKLITYPSFKVTLKFKGNINYFRIVPKDTGLFKMDPIDELFDKQRSSFDDKIINYDVFTKYLSPAVIIPGFLGIRFLIITHPDFLTPSQNLRDHKISLGISTTVVTTQTISNKFGDGSGMVTDSQIKDYIKDYYSHSFIKIKWFLLMGDAEFIPTHYTTQNSWDRALNAGDQFYGQLDDNDLSIPMFGIGRLPVDTEQQAQTIVNKIIEYENNPPSIFNRYYYDLTFGAQFQDDEPDNQDNRWFVETTENIRDYLLTINLTPERIYSAPTASDPTYYNDGTEIPEELQRPTFAWDGNTTDIINSTNDGTSILYHRDHGWWTGWGTPSFSTTNLGSINVTGNEFPAVFSINCASGIFDNETVDLPEHIVGTGYGPNVGSVYWAETFIRMEDGAIGVIGDTRSSSTTLNNTMAIGLFDAIFPAYDLFGSSSSIRKLGDVLNHAKSYVSASGYSDESIKQENTIYNLLGDPTISVKTKRFWILDIVNIINKMKFLEIQLKYIEPECLSCPPLNPAFREKTLVVLQESKSGRVIVRGVVDEKGMLSLPLGNYQGELILTFSSTDVKTYQHKYVVK